MPSETAPPDEQQDDQPVNLGSPFPLMFGRATMNLVDPTIFRISALVFASSNGRAAGVIPKRWRIHAAWRASTEWIDTAAASTASDLIR